MTNVGQQLISGTLSGFATTVFLQPFDLLKTRVQQSGALPASRNVVVDTVKHILITDGTKGFWRGTEASLARNVPGFAIYMTGVTQLRTLLARSPYFVQSSRISDTNSLLPKLTSQGNLIAGSSARVAVGFVLNPLAVLKARYESNTHRYTSFAQAFISIVRQGPSEIFRGFVASSLRDAPYAGLFMIFYEAIKQDASLFMAAGTNQAPVVIHLFSAASAGAVATTITHPFDVIKTNMQIRPESHYHKFDTTVKTIWQNRGISGFFDGLSLRMFRKVFSSAIGWAVYEGILIFMHNNGSRGSRTDKSE
ncbi:hypothetical protein M378DRAFT_159858 [Amanita muscaria Koide BX008]|uniref:Mitochondrial glycine transporter n=1 Tax=Amanita muscaria (strain Koide BX008) TaxID=946122 RepID=A0A0C2XEZ6_AMAMK|nr:hypothetical protein M378DRAFT_159858 [Amanita muscaria Koide BX008]